MRSTVLSREADARRRNWIRFDDEALDKKAVVVSLGQKETPMVRVSAPSDRSSAVEPEKDGDNVLRHSKGPEDIGREASLAVAKLIPDCTGGAHGASAPHATTAKPMAAKSASTAGAIPRTSR